MKHRHEATTKWNSIRLEILKILLVKYMYPFLEKHVRDDITENAEKKLVAQCGRKFKEMLSAAPYTKHDEDEVIYEIKVMSFIPYDDGKVVCTVVDRNGEQMEHKFFNYLLINEKRSPIEFINKQQKEEEEL